MSGEEQNRGFYKETIEEIQVPEGLAEKVGSITEEKRSRRRVTAGSVVRKVAMAATILMALFVGSNGIAYAMTGETWVETIIIRFKIENTEYEVEAEHRQLKNGENIYIGDFEMENGERGYAVEYDGKATYMYYESVGAELWSSDGKTYIWDGDLEIDVTDDLEEDGRAVGTYESDGILKGYSIKRTEDGFYWWMEMLEEGMEGPDWTTKWTMKLLEGDAAKSYTPLLTPVPAPDSYEWRQFPE